MQVFSCWDEQEKEIRDLSPSRWLVLIMLNEIGSLTVGEVQRKIEKSNGATKVLLHRLNKSGYIGRCDHGTYVISPKGQTALSRLKDMENEVFGETLSSDVYCWAKW